MALRAAARRDVTEPDARAGRAERVQHAKALWEGRAAGYTVLVTARDPNARVREIESYREDVVWAIERLQREEDGSVVAILQRIPVPVGQLAEHARNHCTAPVGTQFPVP